MLEFCNNYEKACIDYSFTPEQGSKYLQNLSESEVKAFYQKHVFAIYHSYTNACKIFLAKFNNVNIQIWFRQYFQSSLLNIIFDKNCRDVSKALEKLRKKFVKLALQGPIYYMSEEVKVG